MMCVMLVMIFLSLVCGSSSSSSSTSSNITGDDLRPCHWSGQDSFLCGSVRGNFFKHFNSYDIWYNDDLCMISVENGQLQVQHTVEDSKILVFKAFPFKELQPVKYTAEIEPFSDLLLIVPKRDDRLVESLQESDVLWNFWTGNYGLTRVSDVLQMFYGVQIFYFASKCFDPYVEDIKCPKMSKPRTRLQVVKPLNTCHGDSIIQFIDANVETLQQLSSKSCDDVNKVAKILLDKHITPTPSLHRFILKQALIQWARDTTCDRQSAITLFKDHMAYQRDLFYKQLVDSLATNVSSADIWANSDDSTDSVMYPILLESVLAVAASKKPSAVLDAIRRVTIFKAIKQYGDHEDEDARKAAKILVGLFHNKKVTSTNGLLTKRAVEAILNWMEHFNGAAFSVLFSQSPLQEISKNWTKAQRRQTSLVPYASDIVKRDMLPEFLGLVAALVNKTTAKSADCFMSAASKVQERMLKATEKLILLCSSENAHNLVSIFANTFIPYPSIAFSLLRWLASHDHQKAYAFMLTTLTSYHLEYNEVAESHKDDPISETVLRFLCHKAPLTVKGRIKTLMPPQHRLYNRLMESLEFTPYASEHEVSGSGLLSRLWCNHIHNQVKLTHKFDDPHCNLIIMSRRSHNLWTSDGQVTFLEDAKNYDEDVLSGHAYLDSRDFPAFSAIHIDRHNRLSAVANSTNPLLAHIITTDSVILIPDLRKSTKSAKQTVPVDSIILVHAANFQRSVNFDDILWLRHLLEQQEDDMLKRQLAAHLMRHFNADLAILVLKHQ